MVFHEFLSFGEFSIFSPILDFTDKHFKNKTLKGYNFIVSKLLFI